jgi:ubiquinone biosynthesis protein
VVSEWIARNLGPIGKIEDAGRGMLTLAGVIADLPAFAARAERLLAKVERITDRDIGAVEEGAAGLNRSGRASAFWSTLALWAIAAGLLVLALG